MKFKPVKSAAFTKTQELSTLCRSAGYVTLHFAEHAEPVGVQAANDYVTSLEYSAQGEYWRRPSAEEVRLMLEKTIQRDMAYGEVSAEEKDAALLVTWFLELFAGEPIEFYSTHDWDAAKSSISTASLVLSGATFGLGVVAVSPRHIGLFLIEDED